MGNFHASESVAARGLDALYNFFVCGTHAPGGVVGVAHDTERMNLELDGFGTPRVLERDSVWPFQKARFARVIQTRDRASQSSRDSAIGSAPSSAATAPP
jgi:hypothetical protein